jgi:molybdopterin converting factor subunit 1
MKLKMLAFGMAREIAGSRDFEMEVEQITDTDSLRLLLELKYPELKNISTYALAVNQQFVTENTVLKENDIVAILPPVSGG